MNAETIAIHSESSPHGNHHEFRFSWLNEAGEIVGYRRETGQLQQDAIELAQYRFPFTSIQEAYVEQRSLRFLVHPLDQPPISLGIRPWNIKAESIKRRIDQFRSWHAASNFLKHSDQRTRDDQRLVECPYCLSTLVLTPFATTPQTYCRHCESLFASDLDSCSSPTIDAIGPSFTLCDRCGYFGPPHSMLQFYFYFLYVDYGFHFDRIHGCKACLRKDAWRMLILNGPFLVGVPWSISQVLRTYRQQAKSDCYRGIESANQLASRGDVQGALAGYTRIMERLSVCAGVKYNLGKCLESLGRYDDASAVYQDALLDCSNYEPALAGLARIQTVSPGQATA